MWSKYEVNYNIPHDNYVKTRTVALTFIIIILLSTLIGSSFAFGHIYYISTTGDDSNLGTDPASAFATFEYALSVLHPGDILRILPGTYNQKVNFNVFGTQAAPITIKGDNPQQMPVLDFDFDEKYLPIQGHNLILQNIEVQEASICIRITGQNIVIEGLVVHDCKGHGIFIQGQNVVIENSTIFLSNLDNRARLPGASWGSGLKVGLNGDKVILRNNAIFHNYGEGIAVTRGTNIYVLHNVVYDNYATQVYVDNSHDVLVEGNLIYCTDATDFDSLDGTESTAIGIGEEEYDEWGARLARIQIVNNITDSCNKGLGYFAAEVPDAGLDTVLIAHNTFWNSDENGLLIVAEPAKTRNTIIANNIIDSAANAGAWIESRTGIDMFSNLWVDGIPAEWRNSNGIGDVYGDPNFIETPAISEPRTFRPAVDSPVVGAAGVLFGYDIVRDFAGVIRTIPTDIGALLHD